MTRETETRSRLIAQITGTPGWVLPEPQAAVSIETAVAFALAFADAEAAAMRERADKALDNARWKVGGVSIDAMEGDNLAVTLCSCFDDPDGEQDENGWTEAAVDGWDATLAAIHAVYVDALARALPATGEVGRG